MSGHSKWAQIKRKKSLTDAKKGRLFSKLSKLIEVAAKKGADQTINLALKTAVDQAMAKNMPAVNIERAIKKGSGLLEGASNLEEIVCEAYGPGGVALLITALTNNKNRTIAEIKHLLTRHGAKLSGAGGVKWLFEPKTDNGKMVWIPKEVIQLSVEGERKLMDLLSDLGDQEDVTEAYTNT